MPRDILDELMLEEGLDFSPKKDNRVTEVIDLDGDTAPVVEEKDYDLKNDFFLLQLVRNCGKKRTHSTEEVVLWAMRMSEKCFKFIRRSY